MRRMAARSIADGRLRPIELRASELAMLLEGIDLRSLKRGKRFRRSG